MQKIDYKKELKALYNPPTNKVVEVVVPKMNYLMLDGEGDPNTAPAYVEAVEAIFGLAYTLKFMVKKGAEAIDYEAIDYTVMPLEGLWWADDMDTFSSERKAEWKWTMMLMQPPMISVEMVSQAIAEVQKKRNPKALPLVRFEAWEEGRCAQIMHIGPFSAEGPNIEKVHHYIEESGHALRGKHHEIYLSDIRKADPAKWKTIIRQPME